MTAAKRRGRPGHPAKDRIIKMGPIPLTDAPRDRNWKEKDLPALETKRGVSAEKGEISKFNRHLRGQVKLREG